MASVYNFLAPKVLLCKGYAKARWPWQPRHRRWRQCRSWPGGDARLRDAQAGPLARGLPASLQRAVRRKAVPADLEADLLRLAAAIEPLVPKVEAMAAKLPELAAQAAEKIPAVAEQAAQVPPPARFPHSIAMTAFVRKRVQGASPSLRRRRCTCARRALVLARPCLLLPLKHAGRCARTRCCWSAGYPF